MFQESPDPGEIQRRAELSLVKVLPFVRITHSKSSRNLLPENFLLLPASARQAQATSGSAHVRCFLPITDHPSLVEVHRIGAG